MADFVMRGALSVAAELVAFVETEVLPGLPVDAPAFWRGLDALIHDLAPQNRALLARREALQSAIDGWHRARRGQPHDAAAYRAFLEEIGYLAPEPEGVTVVTENVDPEIARIAGPQLVAPVMNPRFALNAGNARWGSLYDALYATDALGAPPQRRGFDPARAALARAWVKRFLDDVAPLSGAAHGAVTGYSVANGALVAQTAAGPAPLADPAQFTGWRGSADAPEAVLLNRHDLHLELVIDRAKPVGAADPAGVADVQIEAAVTAIMLEDSIAAVDAADKVAAYRVWLGLMKGSLAVEVKRGDRVETRTMAADRAFTAPDGAPARLPGRALMLVRTVGHLMTTPAIRDRDGAEAPEGIVDAAMVSAIAMHDLAAQRNSPAGSVYIVKPKMHGPEEVAFSDMLFAQVEDMLGVKRDTLKMGVMDEERRTTLNLRACLAAARPRIVFINTGFLDRTGDEIHTSIEAGPMIRKADMKAAAWIRA